MIQQQASNTQEGDTPNYSIDAGFGQTFFSDVYTALSACMMGLHHGQHCLSHLIQVSLAQIGVIRSASSQQFCSILVRDGCGRCTF
jgi:hypothetical protein